jgi:hypothetical protein
MSYNFNDTERKTIQTSISDNLLLIPGQPLPLFDMHDSNPILSRGFDSLREVMGYYKPDVLMLDPKSMFYGSLAENDNSHNTYFVSALKQFVTPEFDSTVLFTHHESKAAGGLGQQQSSRGGQALSDGVRWQVSMSRLTEDDAKKINKLDDINNFVKVEQTKSNYTKFFSPFYLVRDDYGCLDVFDMYQEKNKAGISVIIEALKTNTCKLWELKYAAGKPFIKKCKEIGGKGFGRDEITRVIESGLDSGILRKTNNDYIEVI